MRDWKFHKAQDLRDPYSVEFERQLASMSYLLDAYGSRLTMTKSGDVLPALPAVDQDNKPVFAMQAVACAIHAPDPKDDLVLPGGVRASKTKFARPCIACRHAAVQPAEELKRLWRSPQGIFLCKSCWGGFERRRLRVAEVCGIVCLHCVEDKIKLLQSRDPLNFTDYLTPPG